MRKFFLLLLISFSSFAQKFSIENASIIGNINLNNENKILCPNRREEIALIYNSDETPFDFYGQTFKVIITSAENKSFTADAFPIEIDKSVYFLKGKNYATLSFEVSDLAEGAYELRIQASLPKTGSSLPMKVYVLRSAPKVDFLDSQTDILVKPNNGFQVPISVSSPIPLSRFMVELNNGYRTELSNSSNVIYINNAQDFTYKINRITTLCGVSEVKNSTTKTVKVTKNFWVRHLINYPNSCIGNKVSFVIVGLDKNTLSNQKFEAEINTNPIRWLPVSITDSIGTFTIPDDFPMNINYTFNIVSVDKQYNTQYVSSYISAVNRIPEVEITTQEIDAKAGEMYRIEGVLKNSRKATLLFENGETLEIDAYQNVKFGQFNTYEDRNNSLGKNGQGTFSNTQLLNRTDNLFIKGISNECGTFPINKEIKVKSTPEIKVIEAPAAICGSNKFEIKINADESILTNPDFEIRFYANPERYLTKDMVFKLKAEVVSKGVLAFKADNLYDYRDVNKFVIVHLPTGTTTALQPIKLRKPVPINMNFVSFDRFNHKLTVYLNIDAYDTDTITVSYNNGITRKYHSSFYRDEFKYFSNEPFVVKTTSVSHVCGNMPYTFEASPNNNILYYPYYPLSLEKTWDDKVCSATKVISRLKILEKLPENTKLEVEYRPLSGGYTKRYLQSTIKNDSIVFQTPSETGQYAIRLTTADGSKVSGEYTFSVIPTNPSISTFIGFLAYENQNMKYYPSNSFGNNNPLFHNGTNLRVYPYISLGNFYDVNSGNNFSVSVNDLTIENQQGKVFNVPNVTYIPINLNDVLTLKSYNAGCGVKTAPSGNNKLQIVQSPYIFTAQQKSTSNNFCTNEKVYFNTKKLTIFPKNAKFFARFYTAADYKTKVLDVPCEENAENSELFFTIPDNEALYGKSLYIRFFTTLDNKEYIQANTEQNIALTINTKPTAKLLSPDKKSLILEFSKPITYVWGKLNNGYTFSTNQKTYNFSTLMAGTYFLENLQNDCGIIDVKDKVQLNGDSSATPYGYINFPLIYNKICVGDSVLINTFVSATLPPPYIFTDKNGNELFRTDAITKDIKIKTDERYLNGIMLKVGNKTANISSIFINTKPDLITPTYKAVYSDETASLAGYKNGSNAEILFKTADNKEFYSSKGIRNPESKVYQFKQAQNFCGVTNLDWNYKVEAIPSSEVKLTPYPLISTICKNDTVLFGYNLSKGSLNADNKLSMLLYDEAGNLAGEFPAFKNGYNVGIKVGDNIAAKPYLLRLRTTSPATLSPTSPYFLTLRETSTAKISSFSQPSVLNPNASVTIELNNLSKQPNTNDLATIAYKIDNELKKATADNVTSLNVNFPFTTQKTFELLNVSSNTCRNWKIEGDRKITVELILANENPALNYKVYPNPTDDYLIIDGIENLTEGFIEINSVLGKQVYHEEIKNLKPNKLISVKDLSVGSYYLVIESANKRAVFRINKL